ncbi:MAG: zinc-binding dehydrogenase [Verrucomicrobiota bacterium]
MATATCLVHTAPASVELRPVELAPLQEGELLIETLFSAISPGTELRCLRGRQPGGATGPFVPGYAATGRIAAVGPGCRRQVGETVYHGQGAGFLGGVASQWGAHASHVVVAEAAVLDLPAGLDPAPASLAKIAAVAWHGLEKAAIKAGERVAVVGLGPIGQCSARLARERGASVVAFDLVASRVETAMAAGVDAVQVGATLVDAARRRGWPETDFDVIIDVTGVPQLIDSIAELAREPAPWHAPLRPGSRYLIQGSYTAQAAFDYQKAFLKELTFFVPRDNTRADLEEVLAQMARGRLVVSDLFEAPVSPRVAPGIYAGMGKPGELRSTAVFDWAQL